MTQLPTTTATTTTNNEHLVKLEGAAVRGARAVGISLEKEEEKKEFAVFKGVSQDGNYVDGRKKYKARITIPGTQDALSSFDTAEEAALTERVYDEFTSGDNTDVDRFEFVYGINGVETRPLDASVNEEELGLFISVKAKAHDATFAKSHLALLRATLLHYGFEGRKATAGNLAFPFSPSDMEVVSSCTHVDVGWETKGLIRNPRQQKLHATNTLGFKGVYRNGNNYGARLSVDGTQRHLGTFDTKTKAALAFDRAVIQNRFPSSYFNFVHNEYAHEDDDETEEAELTRNPHQKLTPSNSTGFKGVSQSKNRYKAQIKIGGIIKYLGTFATTTQAALAYDRAVIKNKLPAFSLNFVHSEDSHEEVEEEADV